MLIGFNINIQKLTPVKIFWSVIEENISYNSKNLRHKWSNVTKNLNRKKNSTEL